MISFDEATRIVLDAAAPLDSETIAIGDGIGRVLAGDVTARTDQPPFDASAMDGYAVAAEGLAAGREYAVVFEVGAGTVPARALQPGEVARIFTGGALPEGADTVVIQENAERDGDIVRFTEVGERGRNVRARGKDFSVGTTLLTAGTRVGPRQLALAAAGNVADLTVVRQPHVAMLSSGNELAQPGDDLQPGQIVGSNGYMLGALFEKSGARVTDCGNALDDRALLKAALEAALADAPDVLVTTGGASVGDHDLLVPTLEDLGGETLFWRVSIRPGKPAALVKLGKTLVFALPGNPVSAYVTACLYVLPALARMQNVAPPQFSVSRLGAPLPAGGPRRHFIRGTTSRADGQLTVHPLSELDSAHLTTLAQADTLIMVPEHSDALPEGSLVQVLPLP